MGLGVVSMKNIFDKVEPLSCVSIFLMALSKCKNKENLQNDISVEDNDLSAHLYSLIRALADCVLKVIRSNIDHKQQRLIRLDNWVYLILR